MDDDEVTGPPPPAPRRATRTGVVAAAIATVTILVLGGAVAVANAGDHGTPAAATQAASGAGGTTATTVHDHAAGSPPAGGAQRGRPAAGGAGGHEHAHPPLTPYDQRVAAASPDEQAAAADLRSAVADTLAAYADVDAAVAAGYRPPRDPTRRIAHYLNVANATDGKVLDPAAPEGLVYYTGGDGPPVLLGAFFVAPRGQAVPDDTGGIVVWHSHDPACTGFFATPEAPCTDQRRMLHVWTAERVDLVSPRTGQTVTVDITDPFGAPFTASIARAA